MPLTFLAAARFPYTRLFFCSLTLFPVPHIDSPIPDWLTFRNRSAVVLIPFQLFLVAVPPTTSHFPLFYICLFHFLNSPNCPAVLLVLIVPRCSVFHRSAGDKVAQKYYIQRCNDKSFKGSSRELLYSLFSIYTVHQ